MSMLCFPFPEATSPFPEATFRGALGAQNALYFYRFWTRRLTSKLRHTQLQKRSPGTCQAMLLPVSGGNLSGSPWGTQRSDLSRFWTRQLTGKLRHTQLQKRSPGSCQAMLFSVSGGNLLAKHFRLSPSVSDDPFTLGACYPFWSAVSACHPSGGLGADYGRSTAGTMTS